MMLNDLYKKMIKDEAEKPVIDEFLRYSPLSWGHLTFTGRYTFKSSKTKIELQKQIDLLEKKLRKDLWKKKKILTTYSSNCYCKNMFLQ